MLGVRPEWDGLRIEPCLPPGWTRAAMTRPYRGCMYDIHIDRASVEQTQTWAGGLHAEISLDGKRLPGNVIPAPTELGRRHDVRVRCR